MQLATSLVLRGAAYQRRNAGNKGPLEPPHSFPHEGERERGGERGKEIERKMETERERKLQIKEGEEERGGEKKGGREPDNSTDYQTQIFEIYDLQPSSHVSSSSYDTQVSSSSFITCNPPHADFLRPLSMASLAVVLFSPVQHPQWMYCA